METIFGLSTILGKSGVAVIRISGATATDALKVFGIHDCSARYAKFVKLKHEGHVIDEALAIYFKSPSSFTGEDIVEFHTHGSIAVINQMLGILSIIKGFRMAEPGEFSKRAFENNKMDLTQSEGLADLIEAETDAQHKQAVRQMQGELGKIYDAWRESLVKLLARVEAYIDFPDEDLPKELQEEILKLVHDLYKSIEEHLNDNKRGEKIRQGLYAVILGAPNVGKSSLLNFLAKREAAIVSDIAGTTRDVVEVSLDISGVPVTFADTAGIREAADEIESEGIRRALERAEDADLKIIMFDANTGRDKELEDLVDENSIVLVNKIDINPHLAEKGEYAVSIRDEKNLQDFLTALTQRIADQYSVSESPVITRARHREALQKALISLEGFSFDKPIELVGEDLRYAATSIGKITGKIDIEELLDEIFSSFCIGK